MFEGIIFSFYKFFLLKNLITYNLIFLKLNLELNYLNISESFCVQGVCLTLKYKSLFFFEFEFSYITFLNIIFFQSNYFNFEKSIKFFNNFNGHYIYGHINNFLILKNIYKNYNIIKIYFIYFIKLKNYFLYKNSLSLNGVSLTINEFICFDNYFLISLNILYFTFFFTNLKFLKIFNFLNLEFDFSFTLILKLLFLI